MMRNNTMSHHDEKKACQDYYRSAADNYNLKRFSSTAAALVDEVILSVLNQTHDDFEFIIVNDGSTDRSLLT